MSERRWYPTGTSLADGRVLTSSGSKYAHMLVFGGRRRAGPLAADLIHRFGYVFNGTWDSPVDDITGTTATDTLEPAPREGHSVTQRPDYLFGGTDGTQFFNDFWAVEVHRDMQQTDDYQYQWYDLQPSPPDQQRPRGRADHAATRVNDTTLVFFGGRGDADTVFSDVWVGRRLPGTKCGWDRVTISGPSPSARFGHSMATVRRGAEDLHLMYGGIGAAGQNPSDLTLWRLVFTDTAFTAAVWESVAVTSLARPAPRWDHTLLSDPATRNFNPGGLNPRSLIMFGGRGQFGSDTLTNEVWRLWVYTDSIAWERDTLAGKIPRGRGGHSATLDASVRSMLVMGGVTTGGSGRDSVYEALFEGRGTPVAWREMAPHGDTLSGHAAILSPIAFSRLSEIYNPSSDTWSRLDGSPLLQPWYPFMHVVPGSGHGAAGRVFYSGPNKDTYLWREGDSPTWTRTPGVTDANAIGGGSAVMYRPGKVMKTGWGSGDGGTVAHGKTRTIDLNQASPAWQVSGEMQGRHNHNLVVLPNGKVMVLGGTTTTSNQATDGVLRPQIWDPDANVGAGRGPVRSAPTRWLRTPTSATTIPRRSCFPTAASSRRAARPTPRPGNTPTSIVRPTCS